MIWTGEPMFTPRAEYVIPYEGPAPDGLRIHHAGPHEPVTVLRRGLVTEDMPSFYDCMKGFEGLFLKPFTDAGGRISGIDNMIVRFKPTEAHVRINLAQGMSMNVLPWEDVEAGQAVHFGLIKSFHEVYFDNEVFEPGTGVLLYFYIDWHRFVYFDIIPLLDPNETHDMLPRHLAAGVNRRLYPMPTKAQVALLERENWFAFSIIPHHRWNYFFDRLDQGVTWERIESDLLNEVTPEKLQDAVDKLEQHHNFRIVKGFAQKALKHYFKEEYLAATSILMPRIEGILGSRFATRKADLILSGLEQHIIAPLEHLEGLYPALFKEYLKKIYFRSFEPTDTDVQLSRHSHSHGASLYDDYNQKNALIHFLILHQLYEYTLALDAINNPPEETEEIGSEET